MDPQARPLARVVICGAGAVGSAYAERFHDADPAGLAIVAGGERRARLLREGLAVNGRRFAVRCLAPDGRTSMLQDVEAGRKTEVEIFAGTVVELGRRHGVPTPVNDLLGRMLHALERMRAVRT